MARPNCWIINNYDYRPSNLPQREFSAAVVLHSHSYHSEENLGILNDVMELPILSKLNKFFKRSFRLKAKEELDFSNLHYSPPISAEEAYDLELKGIQELGFERMLMAITDHDKIAAGQELLEARPELKDFSAIGEELSFKFDKQIFHLCVLGIPAYSAEEYHKTLQEYAQRGDLDNMFELLEEIGCLVVLNHPFYRLNGVDNHEELLMRLLKRYSSKIHALEFNGMRRRNENEKTLELARWLRKPVVGGGDRHSPIPSLALAAAREATTFPDYIEEVKSGSGVTICKSDYFIPHGWKYFVRILYYVEAYRRITFYKQVPITDYPIDDRIITDTFADIARFLLRIIGRFGMLR